MTLIDLAPKMKAIVTDIDLAPRFATRLQTMGMLPGATAEILHIAPLGDPLQVKVGNTLLSIRKHDATQIKIELL